MNVLAVIIRVIYRLPNYKLRSVLYENGLISEFKNLRFLARYYSLRKYDIAADDCIDKLIDLERSDPVAFDEARRAAASDRNRNARLKRRITKMLNKGNCVFLTLTFTDEVLQSTTQEQRRLYVVRYLKSQSDTYIANIDFGASNGREHYHSILLGEVNISRWAYGNLDAKRIIRSSNPAVLGNYVNKLVNHAIKETAKRSHLIYSRRSPA